MGTSNGVIRRVLALGAAGTAVALAVGLMPSSGSATTCVVEDGDQIDRPTRSVRIATYNASARTTVRENRQDMKRLVRAGADIISLQEMSSRKKRKMIRRRFDTCDDCSYNAYIPIRDVPGALPILYREDKFDFVDLGLLKATDDTYVGPRGAGPSTLRARYVTWVKLRDFKTGRMVYVLNTHGVPTVQQSSGRPNWRLKERVLMYRKHIRATRDLVAEFRSTGAAVFVTGDLNVNYRTDRKVRARAFPYWNFARVRSQASYKALGMPNTGTHVLPNGFDKRLIDYVYYARRMWVEPTSQRIMFGQHSDHRPLLVDFDLYSWKCFEGRNNICVD